MSSAGEVLFGAFYVDDTIKVRPNLTVELGLRDEFTTGWNEESGRASNYIPAQRACWRPRRMVGNSVFTKNNAKHLLGPTRRPRVGPVQERQNRDPRRLWDVLFADRRSEFPAELAASV